MITKSLASSLGFEFQDRIGWIGSVKVYHRHYNYSGSYFEFEWPDGKTDTYEASAIIQLYLINHKPLDQCFIKDIATALNMGAYYATEFCKDAWSNIVAEMGIRKKGAGKRTDYQRCDAVIAHVYVGSSNLVGSTIRFAETPMQWPPSASLYTAKNVLNSSNNASSAGTKPRV